jgi:hypothetical protein
LIGINAPIAVCWLISQPVGSADLAFVAFIIIITAIAVMLTLTQIYLQNPK